MRKIIFICTLICMLSGCTSVNKNSQASSDFFAMDTFMTLSAYGENAEQTLEQCEQLITELENKISRTIETSDIYVLNHSDGQIVTVSDDTYDILTIAYQCAMITDGVFDPTICAISDLWSIGTEYPRVPSEFEIANTLDTVCYENIILLEDNKVQLLNNAQIDLGAVGKGYAADKIVEVYEKNGIIRGVISLAGNIYVYGEKEDNDLWTIGITDPDETGEIAATIKTTDNSIVTTGAYERYFEQDGEIYHHIFDTTTGYPTNKDITSVTIISKTSALADIYATALFAMGYDKALDFLENNQDISAVIIRDDNTVYFSEDLVVSLMANYREISN